MGKGKTHVFIVNQTADATNGDTKPRLIRGTLREVEAKLRAEVSIEPCSAEQAHTMADVAIEEVGEL